MISVKNHYICRNFYTMKKIDLQRLRKAAGMSQKELADRLAVQPSFLSAIENGRSRFPDEKIERLKEVVALDNLNDFMVDEQVDGTIVPPHSHALDETDSLSQMLRHIHNLAHKNDGGDRERINELLDRIDYLIKRNDRLTDRVDQLRDKIERLTEENFTLKELLLKNRIDF